MKNEKIIKSVSQSVSQRGQSVSQSVIQLVSESVRQAVSRLCRRTQSTFPNDSQDWSVRVSVYVSTTFDKDFVSRKNR